MQKDGIQTKPLTCKVKEKQKKDRRTKQWFCLSDKLGTVHFFWDRGGGGGGGGGLVGFGRLSFGNCMTPSS